MGSFGFERGLLVACEIVALRAAKSGVGSWAQKDQPAVRGLPNKRPIPRIR